MALTQGHFQAYDFILEDTKLARFATSAEANRTPDKHELDVFPNATIIDDGYSWLPDPEIDWRSVLHLVEQRANWQRSAAGLFP